MLSVKPANWQAVNGTCLQGYITCDYKTLKKIFGNPENGDGYKVDAEWLIQFNDGVVATIYNYKDGKNYCGRNGLAKKHLTDWHIGGKSAMAERTVEQYIEQYFALKRAKEADKAIA